MKPTVKVLALAATYGSITLPNGRGHPMYGLWDQISKGFIVGLTQERVDALTSLALDVQTQNKWAEFERAVVWPVNRQYWQVAAGGFMKFVLVDGVPSIPLIRKRQEEHRLFLTPETKNVRTQP